jgi:hypothetical protein
MGDVATLLFVHFNFIIQLRNMFLFLKSIHISIQKLINIDRRKLVEILVLILKEVIDRFIWTIELCHI